MACDNLAEKGFKLVATCSSGANGLATAGFSVLGSQMNANQQDFVTKRNSGDFEEQRWAHYTEYVFYREPHLSTADSIAESR
uniref:Protein-tyrosine-phosphatase n=1 Tax=Rhabditophanes sp. KR3021 TaxID=114890 RepID=A0AC35U7E1_9BILA